jgi:hypothetical protein
MTRMFALVSKTRLRVALVLAALAVPAYLGTWWVAGALPPAGAEGTDPPRPLPFNHRHHAGEMGIDCRYCHTSVERAPHAGMPSVDTCMTCHASVDPRPQITAAARWRRVLDLPDHAVFDHSIHVQRGVACVTCHGRVDRMVAFHQVRPFTMAWCLDCHRDPAPHLRPRERLFDMDWQPPGDAPGQGEALLQAYGVRDDITHCNVCHQ